MTYSVKEIYLTLQGEGRNTGRPAVFCRFAGCNLWSGREEDREDARCRGPDARTVGACAARYRAAATSTCVAAGVPRSTCH